MYQKNFHNFEGRYPGIQTLKKIARYPELKASAITETDDIFLSLMASSATKNIILIHSYFNQFASKFSRQIRLIEMLKNDTD